MSLKAEIVFENRHIIVLYKPAGLPVQTASISKEDVCSQLKNHLKGGYVGVVHRLDQPVEGLLCFAKDKETAARLTADLGSGRLVKSYKAVVFGKAPRCGSDVCYMKKSSEGTSIIGEGEDYKKAELSYELLETRKETSLLDISIKTGRFHQIRAQMAHLSFPILGDAKYGSPESRKLSEELGIVTPALCADRLKLYDTESSSFREFDVTPRNAAFKLYEQIDS
ncbi:MAG: RNA pseudouridine synthase [Lachnospiraceae bacterium]|nr:RNA pseudouridine synthase [Lachnospiraceae bacterium]